MAQLHTVFLQLTLCNYARTALFPCYLNGTASLFCIVFWLYASFPLHLMYRIWCLYSVHRSTIEVSPCFSMFLQRLMIWRNCFPSGYNSSWGNFPTSSRTETAASFITLVSSTSRSSLILIFLLLLILNLNCQVFYQPDREDSSCSRHSASWIKFTSL